MSVGDAKRCRVFADNQKSLFTWFSSWKFIFPIAKLTSEFKPFPVVVGILWFGVSLIKLLVDRSMNWELRESVSRRAMWHNTVHYKACAYWSAPALPRLQHCLHIQGGHYLWGSFLSRPSVLLLSLLLCVYRFVLFFLNQFAFPQRKYHSIIFCFLTRFITCVHHSES